MTLRNTPTTYGAISILLHWLAAVAVIGLFAFGLWMVDLGYYDVWYHRAPALHKAVGMVLVLVLALRVIWRWVGGVPGPEPGARPWEIRAAHMVHGLLNFGVLAVIASGYLMTTAKGDAVDVFGVVTIPASIHGLPRQEDVAGAVHYWLAVALVSLAGLHALAAFKHHFIDRDATLMRMLGLKRARTSRTMTPHVSRE